MNEGDGRRGGAAFVAAGILVSRVLGFVRQRLLGHFLGTGEAADALTAAIRIPNVLQNLFGEGVLSASFIPVYARLRAHGDEAEAGRVAGAIGALLALACSVVVMLGIVLSPIIVPIIAPGFTDDKRALTILLTQAIFPGVGLLVMSAWALGILNSHRRFFLSYASPAAMNLVMIAALAWYGPGAGGSLDGEAGLVILLAWATVIGSAAQFLVQLPTVVRVERRMRFELDVQRDGVRTVLRNFAPVCAGRGVAQVSAYVDSLIATLVGGGAVAVLGYAQAISILPVSLFGMSVSAAELPAMAGEVGTSDEVAAALRRRLGDGLRRIAFYVVPSAVAFLALGDVLGGLLYQTGQFRRADVVWLWAVLAGSGIGLLSGTLARLYSSTWYALGDTRTPLRFAAVRVAVGTALGLVAALGVPRMLGLDARWGVAGLTAAGGVAAWVEFTLLRRSIATRISAPPVDSRYLTMLWGCAAVAALPAWGAKLALGAEHPVRLGLVALPLYGATYLAATSAAGIAETEGLRRSLARLAGRR